MRHNKRKHKLGVSGPHRAAMMGNLMTALITHGRIETTISKTRALRPVIEKIITLAKKAEKANDAARKLHYRRLAIARVRDKKAVAKLFDERVSEFTDRNGGYTRIYKLGQRIGDAAEMALIEFVDGNDEGYSKKPKKKTVKKKAVKKRPVLLSLVILLLVIAHLKRLKERILRDIHLTKLAHTLFALFLLFKQFTLTADITAITFCRHIFTKR